MNQHDQSKTAREYAEANNQPYIVWPEDLHALNVEHDYSRLPVLTKEPDPLDWQWIGAIRLPTELPVFIEGLAYARLVKEAGYAQIYRRKG